MFERFKKNDGESRHGGGVATRERAHEGGVADRDRAHEGGGARSQEAVAHEREAVEAPGRSRGSREIRAEQREQFGGINFGAAFFGWLVAVGVAAILTAIASAAGAAFGLTENSPETVGIASGIILLVILMIAYYAGGYVAGRMSRFDGARQGIGAWVVGLIITILAAIAGAILGSEYNVLSQLNLPNIPIDSGSLTTGGLIALAAILLGTLLAGIFGGKVGERYHKKIDRYAFD